MTNLCYLDAVFVLKTVEAASNLIMFGGLTGKVLPLRVASTMMQPC